MLQFAAASASDEAIVLMCEADQRAAADDVIQYVLAARSGSDSLARALTLVGGTMILLELDGDRDQCRQMLATANTICREFSASIAGMTVPHRAAHHHFHLSTAYELLGEALRDADRCLLDRDHVLRGQARRRLEAVQDNLSAATRCLPGFEVIDPSQSCCAHHAAAARLLPSRR